MTESPAETQRAKLNGKLCKIATKRPSALQRVSQSVTPKLTQKHAASQSAILTPTVRAIAIPWGHRRMALLMPSQTAMLGGRHSATCSQSRWRWPAETWTRCVSQSVTPKPTQKKHASQSANLTPTVRAIAMPWPRAIERHRRMALWTPSQTAMPARRRYWKSWKSTATS